MKIGGLKTTTSEQTHGIVTLLRAYRQYQAQGFGGSRWPFLTAMKRRMGVLFEGLYLHDGLLLDNTFYYYYYIAYVSAINCFGVSSLFFLVIIITYHHHRPWTFLLGLVGRHIMHYNRHFVFTSYLVILWAYKHLVSCFIFNRTTRVRKQIRRTNT